MLLTITVTQEHIDKGLRADCFHCPIALALKQQLGALWVDVMQDKFYYGYEGDYYSPARGCELPPSAFEFIARFDNLRPVEPFTFEVTV